MLITLLYYISESWFTYASWEMGVGWGASIGCLSIFWNVYVTRFQLLSMQRSPVPKVAATLGWARRQEEGPSSFRCMANSPLARATDIGTKENDRKISC
jgi:hypothetical protein